MRHKLTVAERVRGLRAALRSRRTPKHFRPFIEKRLRELEPDLERERSKARRKKKPGLLDFFGW
jgi:hypothetical protein